MNVLLPTLTFLVGLAFTVVLLSRFAARRQPYYAVWALGLLWYALASGAEAFGGAFGWSAGLYRLWYATGAIGVAAYLGAGTLFLHRDQPFGAFTVLFMLGGAAADLATDHVDIALLALGAAIVLGAILNLTPRFFPGAVLVVLVLASVAATYRIANAPVDTSLLPTSPDQIVSGQALDADARALTPPFNIAGALVLTLGAVVSALHFWRTRADSNHVLSNVLIAAGAFVDSGATGLTRFGWTPLFYVGQLVGLGCIVAGFLLATARRASLWQR